MARKQLLLGPQVHVWPSDMMHELQVQGLDRWLKGVDNGVERAPKAILYVKGADRWRYEAEWPMADAQPARLFLQAGGRGPFRQAEYSRSGVIVLERSRFHAGPRPAWVRVRLQLITQPATRLAALLAGDQDMIEAAGHRGSAETPK